MSAHRFGHGLRTTHERAVAQMPACAEHGIRQLKPPHNLPPGESGMTTAAPIGVLEPQVFGLRMESAPVHRPAARQADW
jgi:hypothetical protein